MLLAESEELHKQPYDIAEPDLLEAIQSRLNQMEKSGELAKKQYKYRDHVIGAIENPQPCDSSFKHSNPGSQRVAAWHWWRKSIHHHPIATT
ncbi:MAG: hypothetical protein WB870_15530 [Gallionellaceae bacterium]